MGASKFTTNICVVILASELVIESVIWTLEIMGTSVSLFLLANARRYGDKAKATLSGGTQSLRIQRGFCFFDF